MKPKSFRKGVGAFLINKHKKVFVAKRIFPTNAWQMPQGGVEVNEKFNTAILRELLEEIGTNDVEIIEQTPPLKYLFPEMLSNNNLSNNYVGQEIIWYGLLFKGIDSDINLEYSAHPEFTEWKWVSPDTILNLIVYFKRNMYEAILTHMKVNKII